LILLRQTGWMIVRQLRNVSRQPVWVGVMVAQPLIWLLLYGQLFSRVEVLRAGASSYVEFLVPGIVCMNAFFAGSWSGLAMIEDLEHHVIDRFLATPTARSAIVLSQVLRAGIVAIAQAVAVLLLGLAVGVHVHGGAAGWLVVLAASAFLATTFAGLSHGIALLVRREASMIAVANLIGLPLVFLSAILIPSQQMPGWIEEASRFNPVNWGVRAARNGVTTGGEWGATSGWLLLLLAATVATTTFATWCFRAYQRSV
jgi:ABC-2 type transport system permease protein